MSYYLEIWLRGSAKDKLRKLSKQDSASYHPHVTLIRPFKIISSKDEVKNKVVSLCRNFDPIPFYLEGLGHFDKEFYHVPLYEDGDLTRLDNGLEYLLRDDVIFRKKLDEEKKFHATVNKDEGGFYCPRIDHSVIRITAICDDKIWFSYDLATGEVLDRDQSLEKERWYESVSKVKLDKKRV